MTTNLPAQRDDDPLSVELETRVDYDDPQVQQFHQDLTVALIPLALIAFLVISFVVAAWTFLGVR